MSRSCGASLKAHLAGEATTVAYCCEARLTDGTVRRFTSLDRDLTVGGDLYSSTGRFEVSAIEYDRGLQPDNLQIRAPFDSELADEADVRAGRLAGCEFDLFLVNWADTSMGRLYLAKGWRFGEINLSDFGWVAEVLGLADRLNNRIGQVFSRSCRAELGDARCGIDLGDTTADWTQQGYVASTISASEFVASALAVPSGQDFYRYGLVRWLAPASGDSWLGLNAGLSMEIKAFDAGTSRVTLFESMPFQIGPDDEFEIVAGCDKTLATCRDRFSNAVNFRGEPYIPAAAAVPVKSAGKGGRNAWRR